MPRPTTPLISRETAASTALEIIDDHGLDELSLEKLAKAMGVRAPSLYHHFSNKDEILAEVARLIVLETKLPKQRADDEWVEWFVALSQNFRKTILRHRNAAPVLLRFLPRELLVNLYENAAAYLHRSGVAPERHVLILDGLEKLTLGAALTEAMQPERASRRVFPTIDAATEPTLSEALAANHMSPDELFEVEVRTFVAGVASTVRL